MNVPGGRQSVDSARGTASGIDLQLLIHKHFTLGRQRRAVVPVSASVYLSLGIFLSPTRDLVRTSFAGRLTRMGYPRQWASRRRRVAVPTAGVVSEMGVGGVNTLRSRLPNSRGPTWQRDSASGPRDYLKSATFRTSAHPATNHQAEWKWTLPRCTSGQKRLFSDSLAVNPHYL